MAVSAARLKHLWIQGVCADRRISGDAARILVYCADRYVLSGEGAFSIKQETVAANLGFQKRQTVGAAFQRGCDLGWLQKYERQRGRGWHAGDAYILTFPADKIPTPASGYADEEIGAPPQTYSDDEIGPPSRTLSDSEGLAKGSTDEEYVRGDVKIGPSPRQNRSVATVEIGPRPRHENPSTPAETPDLNGVYEWFSTNDVKAHDVAREEEPDIGKLFNGLFNGNRTNGNGNGQRALTASMVIDTEIIETYFEHPDSRLRSSGLLTATTEELVDFEENRAGHLARLQAAFPDAWN